MVVLIVCVGSLVFWLGVMVFLPWSTCPFNPRVKLQKFVRRISGGERYLADSDADPQRVEVHFLDGDQVKTVSIRQLMKKRWPVELGAKPRCFLIEGSKNPDTWGSTAGVWFVLAYSDAEQRWQAREDYAGGIRLTDRFGMQTTVKAGPEMIKEALVLVRDYGSVYHLLYEQVSRHCEPLLAETKRSVGRSPVLEVIREILGTGIQGGLYLITQSHDLDIPGMVARRQELYKKAA